VQPQTYPQTYRDPAGDRLYVCPTCHTAQRGPAAGGPVACPQCRSQSTLPDRSAMLGAPLAVGMPNDDPGRIAQLRMQDGRPRVVAPTLAAVLGGTGIMPGREQEALVIWQSLRARAAQGDVAASEDMATLTLLLAQLPAMQQQPDMVRALRESTFDAAVLPRHKQEQLGALARGAVVAGDRARAQRYLSWMVPAAPELEADSEFRVSSAVVATMDRDPQRVLALLGPRKDAVPIMDAMDELASVFRANAFETMGDVASAQAVLRELSSPEVLGKVRQAFSGLGLCPHSSTGYVAASNDAAAKRAASSAGRVGIIVGIILAVVGVFEAGLAGTIGAAVGDVTNPAVFINGGIGVAMFVVGIVVAVRGRAKGKHAAWLRVNGVQLTARIMEARMTGTRINNVPLMRFILQVAGPQGPYAASFTKLVPAFQVAQLVGQQVRVRVNPAKLDDLVLEE